MSCKIFTISFRNLSVLTALLFWAACQPSHGQNLPSIKLKVGTQIVEAELALKQEQRAKGLMFRQSMAEMHGMLFSFERDQLLGFYMKNTLIPLSIAYLDKDGVIQEIHDMQALDESTVSSQWPMRFALEMNQGWFERLGVKAGQRVTLDDGSPLAHGKLQELARQ